MPESSFRNYSSRDVQMAAGLSARQQNDWDGRGLLPHTREGQDGWRRFTARDIFILMVCAEIRRQYGTPVERLRFIQEFMLQEGANHLQAAATMIEVLGVSVWLLTDLEGTFIMENELDLIDRWHSGFFNAEHETPFLLMNVNPLVDRFLLQAGETTLDEHSLGREILRETRRRREVRTPEEAFVLEKIRGGEFQRVEVETRDGQVRTVRTSSRPDPSAKLEELLDEPYQRLELIKRDGMVVSIKQEVTTKPAGKQS